MVTDANNVIVRVNQKFTAITGYTAEEIIGKNPRILNSGRQDAKFYVAMWKDIKNGAWEGEIWNRRKDGGVYPEHMVIRAVKDSNGIATHYRRFIHRHHFAQGDRGRNQATGRSMILLRTFLTGCVCWTVSSKRMYPVCVAV